MSHPVFPIPELMRLRELGHDRWAFTLNNMHVSAANAMRRTLLARLPVIGIPFEPYAANKVAVAANTTDDTDQSIWYRIGNIPVHSLNPQLVTDYAVVLDVTNSGNETRIVTTADFRLEHGGGGASGIDVHQVFPACAESGDFIAIAELRPLATGAVAALQLRATFEWVAGSGAFAPNVVGYVFSPDEVAGKAEWESRERDIRTTYAREAGELAAAGLQPSTSISVEETVANAKHDFQVTTSKLYYLEHQFDFTYEVINRAYSLRLAWKKAAELIVGQLETILESIEVDTLECWPVGVAASKGRTSVTPNAMVGGFGYDVIVPGLDYTLGPVINFALQKLCFVRNRAEAEDSDRLNYCAFHQFTPDDDFGVIRLALVRDEHGIVKHHMKAACEALVLLFIGIGKLLQE